MSALGDHGASLDEVAQDMRYALCLFARNRGFTVVIVLTLAVSIGSSSAIFSLINAVVLCPLPIADPQELYIAQAMEPDELEQQSSYPVVAHAVALLGGRAELAAQSSTESVLIATRGGAVGARPREPARMQLVAGDFFGTLRQRAQIGRLLGSGDNRSVGQHPVVVISDRYWSRRFGRTARVLDTELIVNGAIDGHGGRCRSRRRARTLDWADAPA